MNVGLQVDANPYNSKGTTNLFEADVMSDTPSSNSIVHHILNQRFGDFTC